MRALAPERTVYEAKRLIGRAFDDPVRGRRAHLPSAEARVLPPSLETPCDGHRPQQTRPPPVPPLVLQTQRPKGRADRRPVPETASAPAPPGCDAGGLKLPLCARSRRRRRRRDRDPTRECPGARGRGGAGCRPEGSGCRGPAAAQGGGGAQVARAEPLRRAPPAAPRPAHPFPDPTRRRPRAEMTRQPSSLPPPARRV